MNAILLTVSIFGNIFNFLADSRELRKKDFLNQIGPRRLANERDQPNTVDFGTVATYRDPFNRVAREFRQWISHKGLHRLTADTAHPTTEESKTYSTCGSNRYSSLKSLDRLLPTLSVFGSRQSPLPHDMSDALKLEQVLCNGGRNTFLL
eukprot:scaffold1953_cov176-Amphora_coffeaeformis.AAC.55